MSMTITDLDKVNSTWENVKSELEKNLPEHVFTWVKSIIATNVEGSTLSLISPYPMGVDILKKNWSVPIKDAVRKVLGQDANYTLKYDSDYANTYIKGRKKESSKKIAGQTEQEQKEEATKYSLAQMQSSANLNLNLKFENFVVGENSSFAYNAAFTVASNPATKFNPLFIYGASGLGKTHLMQAIGHHIIFNRPDLKVRYIRMEEYFNEWMRCFQHDDNGKSQGVNNSLMRKFHQKFRNVDILLMDDIQFLESKMKTMEDFFSTFEALYTNNKQIVIASDRLPSDIPKLDNRLRTRFEMGLVVDIKQPDYDTRFKIVKAYANEIDSEAEDSVYDYIAQNFVNNVRELKGAFNKVSAYAEFLNVGLTLETAIKALNCHVKKRELTIDKIAQTTADYFGVEVKELKSTARNQKVSKSRQIAIYICRDVLGLSYEAIGEFFEKKHTTVMYAYEQISDKTKLDENIRNTIDEIKAQLKG